MSVAFVCACAKAWKAASQTVISKTMCQLTEGTHAPLYSGLSSGPALCLFFLQWTGSSVYNSHPKPSLWNILPATAARRADAAPTSPNSLPVFARFAEYPPTFFRWSRCFGRQNGVVNWFEAHVNSPAFMSQIPLRVTAFIRCSSRGDVRREASFQVSASCLKPRMAYILQHYADFHICKAWSRGHTKGPDGVFWGGVLGLFGVLNAQLGMRSLPINPHLQGQTGSPSADGGRRVKEGIVQRAEQLDFI